MKIIDREKGLWVTGSVNPPFAEEIVQEERQLVRRKLWIHQSLWKSCRGSENNYTREEVKLKTFSLLNTLLRPTEISHFQSIVLGMGR